MSTVYTPEITKTIIEKFRAGTTIAELAEELDVPERSIIAKLSSLGEYTKKPYTNKQGELPVKKEEYIARIAKLLDTNVEIIESLEKANKNVLKMIEKALLK